MTEPVRQASKRAVKRMFDEAELSHNVPCLIMITVILTIILMGMNGQ